MSAETPPPVSVRLRLKLLRCPHGFMALGISGVAEPLRAERITNGKCCGTWSAERSWEVTKAELIEQIERVTKP